MDENKKTTIFACSIILVILLFLTWIVFFVPDPCEDITGCDLYKCQSKNARTQEGSYQYAMKYTDCVLEEKKGHYEIDGEIGVYVDGKIVLVSPLDKTSRFFQAFSFYNYTVHEIIIHLDYDKYNTGQEE